jgi:hypothetical protein
MQDITCTKCGTATNWLAIFPEDLCLTCYSAKMENAPMPTASELANMWRNPNLTNI